MYAFHFGDCVADYDYIVVGSGSAAAIVAARLAEDPTELARPSLGASGVPGAHPPAPRARRYRTPLVDERAAALIQED